MVKPTMKDDIVPIHTGHAGEYSRYFKNVNCLKDGQKVTV
jgi:hypothetical protein